MYVEHLTEVFREARRVLRDDGTLWLNLGDSYHSSSQNNHGKGGALEHPGLAPRDGWAGHRPRVPGLKMKDLVGIPWRVAFALQADGWYLRSDIIWHKPNPMPESVIDRPTKSHEYLFLMSKSERYYYDYEAVKEPAVSDHPSGNGYKRPERLSRGGRGSDEPWQPSALRNRRSVWTITTKPFKEAHFATFPTALIEPCILAGSPKGGTVLDPFGGAGTVGVAAVMHDRRYVLIELNPAYAAIAEKRLHGVQVEIV
jgi:DNA modification methylase